MNDILLFGGGYSGDKRKVEGTPVLFNHPTRPVLVSSGPAGMRSRGETFTTYLDFSVCKHNYNGNDYLIALYDTTPSSDEINLAILNERPKPV